MIGAAGNLSIPQNQSLAVNKASGDHSAEPVEANTATDNSTTFESNIQDLTNALPAPPLSPENFNALLQAQDEEGASPFDNELTDEEEKTVRELQQTDREVRAHEAAHKTVGGPYAGNVSFETVTGPDGREYAVAGEVQIDASPISGNPEATIRKMEIVIRAALAPAEPSPQDRAVAAAAQQAKIQAQQELAQQRKKEQEEQSENNDLGILSNNITANDNENSVNSTQSNDSAQNVDAEIITILFGNSTN